MPTTPPLLDLTREARLPQHDAASIWASLTEADPDQWLALQGERVRAAVSFLAERDRWRPEEHGQQAHNEFARLVGANDRSVRRWVTGEWRIGGEILLILLGMLRDPSLATALRDEFRPSGLPLSDSMDRMLFTLRRDPALLDDLLPHHTSPRRRRQRTKS